MIRRNVVSLWGWLLDLEYRPGMVHVPGVERGAFLGHVNFLVISKDNGGVFANREALGKSAPTFSRQGTVGNADELLDGSANLRV